MTELPYLPRKAKALVTVCQVMLDWLNSDEVRGRDDRKEWVIAGSPEAWSKSLGLEVKRKLRFFVEQASCTDIVDRPPVTTVDVDALTSRVDAVSLVKRVQEWAIAQAASKPELAAAGITSTAPKARPGRRTKREKRHDELILGALQVAVQKNDREPPSYTKLAEDASSATCSINKMAVSRYFNTRHGIDKNKFDDLWRKGELTAWLLKRQDEEPSRHAQLDDRD
jgi:hypothetical protein